MPKKILVIDDDQDLPQIIKVFLEKNGYEATIACDGAHALRILKSYVPDLIICDLTMPNMSGWHFTTRVRQDERFKKTPIIVLSGLLDHNAEPEGFESVNAYMVKPFEVTELLNKVQILLK